MFFRRPQSAQAPLKRAVSALRTHHICEMRILAIFSLSGQKSHVFKHSDREALTIANGSRSLVFEKLSREIIIGL